MNITIDRSRAIDLVRDKLRRIHLAREREWEKVIVERIAARDRWRRIFPWLKRLDFETAKTKIYDEQVNAKFGWWPDLLYYAEERTCNAVLRLVNVSSTIHLNEVELKAIT